MTIKTLSHALCLSLIASLMAACGWHLRGTDTSSLQANSIYLSGHNSETYRLVNQQLQRKSALAALNSASLRLILGREEIKRRTVSEGGGGLAQEYELTYTLNYRVEDGQGKLLRPNTTVRLLRSYNFNRNSITASDREEAIIRRELQSAAARQILRQLEILQRK